ncbi:MAG: chromosome partitioning protein [SAR202 cluster bacterium]|nr:chromosome partitioning protein [SAR202 cluster bacterium]
MIVAVIGEKGGTGKTTFSTNLAGLRAVAGRDVLVVDADRQGSASYWAEARGGKGLKPVTCVQKFGEGLARAVRDMSRRYEDIVIDIGAGDSKEIEGALRVADRAIIPVQPTGLDVWTLGLLDDRIAEAKVANDGLKAWVVINRASSNPKDGDTKQAHTAISQCENIKVADFVVRDRVSFKRAVPEGMVVSEYRPADNKAVEEMDKLYKIVFGEENGSHGS